MLTRLGCSLSAAILLCACAHGPALSAERDAVTRDVEGYAIASCLVAQPSPYLKDQGDGWASGIVQRGAGPIEAFTGLAKVVQDEAGKGDMPQSRDETAPMELKPLPIQYCAEIIDTPRVRQAIGDAVKQLTPAYRQR